MSGILMVPIHLDALFLAQDQMVAAATADFAHLPYSDSTQDVNADVANISEDIVSQPFDDQNLYLKAGIHLHWSLPDALTKGTHTSTGTDFPAVPNRWLVMRSKHADGDMASVERTWIVESDYLFPNGVDEQTGSVTVPYTPNANKGQYRPFRYQGRALPLESWQAQDASAEYVEKLTAISYGEPTFAAFYPNCLSVFGLYDADYTTPPAGLCYDVVGWYSDTVQDALTAFIANFTTERAASGQEAPTAQDLQAAVAGAFQWTLSLPPGQEFPGQLLCYARLTFEETQGTIANSAKSDANVIVALGNNSTEALSAYLGSRIDNQHKAAIEDELEALQLSYRLENRRLDIGAKFAQTRHENSFLAVSGGSLWIIHPETDASAPASADSAQEQAETTLPDDLAHQLNALNGYQQTYDQAQARIASLRKQLFSDWYKYMLCAYPPDDARDNYPDSDEVRYYIEQQDIAPLQQALDATGQLSLGYDSTGRLVAANATPANSLAAPLAQALNDLLSALATFNSKNMVKTAYILKSIPAPRYWLPRDPAILLTGAAVVPTERHGKDGLLACQSFANMTVQDVIPGQLAALRKRVAAIDPGTQEDFRGFSTWTQQPWNPFLLDWEFEIAPLNEGNNLDTAYGPDFITSNYALPQDQPDLSLLPGKGTSSNATNVYSGSSILTPYVQERLKGHLEEYLADPQLDKTTDTYQHVRAAHNLLSDAHFHCLSQSLGGLTEALLMHKQTRQLALDDPLAFADYASFTQTVSQYVQKSNTSAPQPDWDFIPIRSGGMRLLRLRLIDTFGQVLDLNWNGVIATEQMTSPQGFDWAELPPRLAQPGRLSLRWLAANADEMEMNDHPATAPICGWVLPNNLDGSLMIYDNQGKVLGLINQSAQWNSQLPGARQIEINAIPNPHLRKMVQYLVNQGEAFLSNFISAVDTGLANIDPENFAQHQDLALLMGRPIALVRAAVNLELRDPPAIHQGWNTFRQDLQRTGRDSENFINVTFPIRLGEYQQLNDGLVGYWIEQGDGYSNDTFYVPQSDPIADAHIRTHADDPAPLRQTIADPPMSVSMLIDPRGTIHATCGVLPAKEINIPPDQYTAALQAIELLFLCAPILTDMGKINLPLPTEAGYRWSWAGSAASIGKVNPQATFSARQEILEGWLQLSEIAPASS